jgi:hypothetical protein
MKCLLEILVLIVEHFFLKIVFQYNFSLLAKYWRVTCPGGPRPVAGQSCMCLTLVRRNHNVRSRLSAAGTQITLPYSRHADTQTGGTWPMWVAGRTGRTDVLV